MEEIINKVWQYIDEDQMSWAYLIVIELNKYHHNLAIKWAVKCIQICLSESKLLKSTELSDYIQQALNSQNILTVSQYDENARKIWDLPERDEIKTAIARLWWAIAAFKAGEERDGIMETTMAVELVLSDTSNHRLLNQYLETAVRICEEHKSKNSS